MLSEVGNTDLVVARESSHHLVRDVVFGHLPDEIAERAHCTTILAYQRKSRTHTFLRFILGRLLC